jgi:hypothetical protein
MYFAERRMMWSRGDFKCSFSCKGYPNEIICSSMENMHRSECMSMACEPELKSWQSHSERNSCIDLRVNEIRIPLSSVYHVTIALPFRFSEQSWFWRTNLSNIIPFVVVELAISMVHVVTQESSYDVQENSRLQTRKIHCHCYEGSQHPSDLDNVSRFTRFSLHSKWLEVVRSKKMLFENPRRWFWEFWRLTISIHISTFRS